MRTFRAALFVALAAATFVEHAALADAPAVPMLRYLGKGKPHPLADGAGRVSVTTALPPGVDARSIGLLPVAPGVGAMRATLDEAQNFSAKHPDLALTVSPLLRPLLDRSGHWTHVDAYRKATGHDGAGVVVGIIDTGIDVTHPDFRDASGKTRIAWLLHTAPARDACHPPRPGSSAKCLEDELGCSDPNQTACVIYDKGEIDAMMQAGQVPGVLRDIEGHGTHVASIAAGNGGPMAGKPKYVGLAPNATIIAASPSLPGHGFADADVLNAARFVFDRADALGLPCVINLSLGGEFGPHDGTSAIERGLAAMVGDAHPGRSIVVAAGNSGALYSTQDAAGPLGTHTEVHVPSHGEARVPIRASKASKGQMYVWLTFRHGDDISVGLDGPDGSPWVDLVPRGQEAGYDENGQNAAVINGLVNGKSTLTSDTVGAVIAIDGSWPEHSEFAIRLQGQGTAELWVTGQGDALNGVLFSHALRQGTINVPASHPQLLAVGCSINRIGWKPLGGPALELQSLGPDSPPKSDGICYFSAAGPTPDGVMKPEIVAPGAFVAAAMSVDADPRNGGLDSMFDAPGCPMGSHCYIVDDHHALATGTSMSAPHVAGAIALLLEERPNATQAELTEILQAGARYPQGPVPHDTQLGVGSLDLEGARVAMMDDPQMGDPPDAAKSWFSLSSEYVRPETDWPVVGTVELRRADGHIATGLDGSRLAVAVAGGTMVQPVTKVKSGLFRFRFGAAPGSGGGEVDVTVTYDGVPIGETRRLPIGLDAWQSRSSPTAEGGCSTTGASTGTSWGTWAGVSLVVAFAALGRRGRRVG
jgi:subtilisin family serine protease